jgi:hypothetical protein
MRARYLISSLAVVALLGGCHPGKDVAPDGVSPPNAAEASPPEASDAAEALPAGAAPDEPGAGSDCETRKAAIEAAFVEASRCTSDADCTTLMPGCPFGCTRAIQRAAASEPILADIAAYNEACNRCVYRCRPVEAPPSCQAGVCTLPPG